MDQKRCEWLENQIADLNNKLLSLTDDDDYKYDGIFDLICTYEVELENLCGQKDG
ncbi:hypothetical protein [Paenibacillus amylolyticus]|uniref:hypothetical protein n=1 Tax=Paenibacillus amylolyticus TaxID=1451 RepID=UPI00201D6F5B|nr:hypothetical protein [Paenibacillus amylolyticus]MCL6664557.1 hypothetical protein [Paenibacillus amylolyticus]